MAKINVRKKRSTKIRGFLKQMTLLLLVFLLGYMTASVEHGTHLKQWFMVQWFDQHVSAASFSAQQAALPRPKFEFYTLLARESGDQVKQPLLAAVKSAVSAPAQELSEKMVAVNTIKDNSVNTKVKETYLVQLASFRHLHEADRLKALLVIKGFPVSIASTTQQGLPWYRVVMGPFTSKVQAQQAQTAFARSEHLTGMVRRVDV